MIQITSPFWKRYQDLVKKEMLPYQWKVLNDAIQIRIEKERDDDEIPNEKSHAIENFRIAAGRSTGEHYGWVFQDSDVYKWLEAAAYALRRDPDEELKKTADGVVDLIAEAQEPDGYIGTYFTIMEPDRKFKRLSESHELYCAGHLMEACVAYYEAVKSGKALQIAEKLAGCIDGHFGPEEGKIHGADGHEEVEIGLMRLYHLTGKEKYEKLAQYFLSIRGTDPDFLKKQNEMDGGPPLIKGVKSAPPAYFQMHLPVSKQDTAEGHAVRVVYLFTALADLAASTGDRELSDACRRLWRNITDKRMYITGGIGSTVRGEAFTLDYDLPNDTMYCETCASVGLIFLARQMLRIEPDGEYADVMERALYNTALAGMALDGKHFFYVNPLEAVPEKSRKDPGKSHVKCVRPQWLGCACCPPNLARLLMSLEDYIYTVKDSVILANLFIRSELTLEAGGGRIEIRQETEYPKEGEVRFHINNQSEHPVTLGIRVPGWTEGQGVSLSSQGDEVLDSRREKGYWYVQAGKGETDVMLKLKMEPKRWHANPLVSSDINKTALSMGPFVYCLEEADNGKDLHCLVLPKDAELRYEWKEELLCSVGTIQADGLRLMPSDPHGGLYCGKETGKPVPQKLSFIPYYAWANRGENEMRVWIHET